MTALHARTTAPTYITQWNRLQEFLVVSPFASEAAVLVLSVPLPTSTTCGYCVPLYSKGVRANTVDIGDFEAHGLLPIVPTQEFVENFLTIVFQRAAICNKSSCMESWAQQRCFKQLLTRLRHRHEDLLLARDRLDHSQLLKCFPQPERRESKEGQAHTLIKTRSGPPLNCVHVLSTACSTHT